MKGWTREIKPILLALGFVLVVRTVLAEPYTVPSASMVPTLLVGDELIGSKFAYGFGKYSSPIGLMPEFSGRLFDRMPERGDVVVFRLPRDPSITYVKRLIGLPGDRIQMQAGRLYINDAMVARRKIGSLSGAILYVETLPASQGGSREHEIAEQSDNDRNDDTPVYVVPAHHYFMMGDNRDDSLDSRIPANEGGVGFVPEENLVARADFLLVSRNPEVSWLDIDKWSHLFRIERILGRIN
jgi:signal peptidase I